MSEFRFNPATRDWVIIATERARRPEDFVHPHRALTQERPSHVDTCPFCTGNEEQAPPAIYEERDESGWRVRVVPNKFPALSADVPLAREGEGFEQRVGGFGFHEVVVEGQAHNLTAGLTSGAEVASTLRAFRARAQALSKVLGIRQVVPFKNHGPSAGTSLEHPHAQLVALPIVPRAVRTRLNDAREYFETHEHCVYCAMMESELASEARLIGQNDHFVAFIPFAAFSPFHVWLMPKRHAAVFTSTTDGEIEALGELLHRVLSKLYRGLHDPDYNYVLRTAPFDLMGVPWFHWYISIVPKIAMMAGFELGSGMYINPARPEDSAQFLREIP